VKKRGLALGIATAGVGLGGVALPPLAAHLIPSFGWHTAFLILGLIGLAVCVPCSWLIKRDPQEMGISPLGGEGTAPGNKSEGATGLSLGEALRTRTMWLIYLILFFYLLSYFTIIGHLVRHMEDMNIAPMSSSLVLSFIGGFGIIGRIGMGSIAEKISPKLSLGIIALVMGLMMLWLIWSGKLWMFYLFGIIYGFFYGGITPLLIMAIAEFFGLRYLGALSGTTAIAVAVGAVAGPIIAGHIFDITQSYNLAFLITAIGLFLATLCALFLKSEVKEPGSCS
jgi:predicted MFS family arabinose efflux permease